LPRIRYLKPEFFSDEDLAELPFQTRLTFQGLWCYADKEGRLEDRPKYLKAMIFPYDKIDIEKELDLLSKGKKSNPLKPFIQRYEVEGRKYISIVSWTDHQSPHHTEKESVFPTPPPYNPPLKEKDKDKEKEKCEEPPSELNNGSNTVNKPLELKDQENQLYGILKNVKLSLAEYLAICKRFGDELAHEKIDTLSEYIGSKGDKYKSHYATILSWDRKDNPKRVLLFNLNPPTDPMERRMWEIEQLRKKKEKEKVNV